MQAYIMEDWDLQAVVRGCTNNIDELPAANYTIDSQPSCFAPLMSVDQYLEDDVFHNFPYDLFEATRALDELEELYKPFYPILHDSISFPPTLLTSSSSAPKEHVKEPDKLIKKIKQPTAKWKRRKKSQEKRVVKEVKAGDLCSDMWAWRKYGQKPIKGSPYPRSYYKCSSSKGCSARKQVERSSANPDMFIIKYTAHEHSHAHPTRRNPRAGSVRSNKVPASEMELSTPLDSNKLLSPTIALISLMPPTDDEFVQSASVITDQVITEEV